MVKIVIVISCILPVADRALARLEDTLTDSVFFNTPWRRVASCAHRNPRQLHVQASPTY